MNSLHAIERHYLEEVQIHAGLESGGQALRKELEEFRLAVDQRTGSLILFDVVS